MKFLRSPKGITSLLLLGVLIVANVWLMVPTGPAFSDTKPGGKSSAAAAPKSKPQDFGAETIELTPAEKRDVKPLPLDLVEDRNDTPPSPVTATAPLTEKSKDADATDIGKDTGENPEVTQLLRGTDIEIAALVKAFSKLTKRNYIVDNNVKGKVTIYLENPVSVPEALRILDSILLLKGFATVPIGDNIWKVIAAKDARQTTIPTVGDNIPGKASDVLVTQLIRLKNIQASEVQQVLTQFVSKEGTINAFGGTNALILIDSAANIKRLRALVDQLDVPAIDQDITIIPILHAEAKDVADKINQILGEGEKQDTTPGRTGNIPNIGSRPISLPGQIPAGGAAPGGITTNAERRMLPLRIIPDERTNSLIVVADQLTTEKVRALAEQLDSEVDRSSGRFYVYRLQHADAEELADILSNLISGGGGATSTSGSKRAQFKGSQSNTFGQNSDSRRNSFGSGSSSFGGSNSRDSFAAATAPGASAGNRGRTGSGSNQSGNPNANDGRVNLEGDVTVTADPSTNSLLINASKGDYQRVKEVIEALDVKRRQVMVEATLLEVSLSKEEGVGVEWTSAGGTDDYGILGQSNMGGLSNLISNPAGLSDLTIAAASTGSIILPGGIAIPSQAILVKALSKNTNVNVLSAPTILATDNEEAEIKVGENVPFVSSTSTNQTNLNNTFNQIERQDVGIKLRILPQISSGDYVVLKIFVEISNVVTDTRDDPNGPTTTIRTSETQVEVKSNQMVVTGGLISDQVNDADRGVPYFKDIPVLGNLFRRDDTLTRRTNLLIFITPKIIVDQWIAREETKDRADKLKDVIADQKSEPDRDEVLNNPNIDRVVEVQPPPSSPPTTVRAPEENPFSPERADKAKRRTLERLKSIAPDQAPVFGSSEERVHDEKPGDQPAPSKQLPAASDDDEVIDLSAKPSLPGVPEFSAQRPQAREANRQAVRQTELPTAGEVYVVLRALDDSQPPPDATFAFADAEHTLGLSLPGTLQSAGAKFFEVGRRYTFTKNGQKLRLVCLGKYASLGEAKVVHPSLGSREKWYNMTPEQTLRLGSGDWKMG